MWKRRGQSAYSFRMRTGSGSAKTEEMTGEAACPDAIERLSSCPEEATLMAQLLVRNLDEALVRRIKKAAAAHHRSVAGEVRVVLDRSFAAPAQRAKALARIDALRRRSKPGLSAAEIVRQVRDGA